MLPFATFSQLDRKQGECACSAQQSPFSAGVAAVSHSPLAIETQYSVA
jgi:hypothetical protein